MRVGVVEKHQVYIKKHLMRVFAKLNGALVVRKEITHKLEESRSESCI